MSNYFRKKRVGRPRRVRYGGAEEDDDEYEQLRKQLEEMYGVQIPKEQFKSPLESEVYGDISEPLSEGEEFDLSFADDDDDYNEDDYNDFVTYLTETVPSNALFEEVLDEMKRKGLLKGVSPLRKLKKTRDKKMRDKFSKFALEHEAINRKKIKMNKKIDEELRILNALEKGAKNKQEVMEINKIKKEVKKVKKKENAALNKKLGIINDHCGMDKPKKGHGPGSAKFCLGRKQVRYYGVNAINPKYLIDR